MLKNLATGMRVLMLRNGCAYICQQPALAPRASRCKRLGGLSAIEAVVADFKQLIIQAAGARDFNNMKSEIINR